MGSDDSRLSRWPDDGVVVLMVVRIFYGERLKLMMWPHSIITFGYQPLSKFSRV